MVRGGGLEPPWLLTASTSSRSDGPPSKDFAELERQETSGSGLKRPILATCSQNSGGAEVRTSGSSESQDSGPDPVLVRLRSARENWEQRRDLRELRRALLDLLQELDG